MKVQAAKSAFQQAGGNLIPSAPMVPVTYAQAPSDPISQAPPAIVSHANGAITPADTPEVQAAKSAFQQAGGNLIPSAPMVPVTNAQAPSAPISQGPPAIVSHANGAITPADTPEV